MEINLSKDSIVNEHTGQIDTPGEYLLNLRSIEVSITRADSDITSLKSDLKTAREAREVLVARLRGAVRDGRCLPLLEVADEGEDDEVDEVDEVDGNKD